MVTKAELEAGKTAKGGYTKTQLAAWGVPYPPSARLAREAIGWRGVPTD